MEKRKVVTKKRRDVCSKIRKRNRSCRKGALKKYLYGGYDCNDNGNKTKNGGMGSVAVLHNGNETQNHKTLIWKKKPNCGRSSGRERGERGCCNNSNNEGHKSISKNAENSVLGNILRNKVKKSRDIITGEQLNRQWVRRGECGEGGSDRRKNIKKLRIKGGI